MDHNFFSFVNRRIFFILSFFLFHDFVAKGLSLHPGLAFFSGRNIVPEPFWKSAARGILNILPIHNGVFLWASLLYGLPLGVSILKEVSGRRMLKGLEKYQQEMKKFKKEIAKNKDAIRLNFSREGYSVGLFNLAQGKEFNSSSASIFDEGSEPEGILKFLQDDPFGKGFKNWWEKNIKCLLNYELTCKRFSEQIQDLFEDYNVAERRKAYLKRKLTVPQGDNGNAAKEFFERNFQQNIDKKNAGEKLVEYARDSVVDKYSDINDKLIEQTIVVRRDFNPAGKKKLQCLFKIDQKEIEQFECALWLAENENNAAECLQHFFKDFFTELPSWEKGKFLSNLFRVFSLKNFIKIPFGNVFDAFLKKNSLYFTAINSKKNEIRLLEGNSSKIEARKIDARDKLLSFSKNAPLGYVEKKITESRQMLSNLRHLALHGKNFFFVNYDKNQGEFLKEIITGERAIAPFHGLELLPLKNVDAKTEKNVAEKRENFFSSADAKGFNIDHDIVCSRYGLNDEYKVKKGQEGDLQGVELQQIQGEKQVEDKNFSVVSYSTILREMMPGDNSSGNEDDLFSIFSAPSKDKNDKNRFLNQLTLAPYLFEKFFTSFTSLGSKELPPYLLFFAKNYYQNELMKMQENNNKQQMQQKVNNEQQMQLKVNDQKEKIIADLEKKIGFYQSKINALNAPQQAQQQEQDKDIKQKKKIGDSADQCSENIYKGFQLIMNYVQLLKKSDSQDANQVKIALDKAKEALNDFYAENNKGDWEELGSFTPFNHPDWLTNFFGDDGLEIGPERCNKNIFDLSTSPSTFASIRLKSELTHNNFEFLSYQASLPGLSQEDRLIMDRENKAFDILKKSREYARQRNIACQTFWGKISHYLWRGDKKLARSISSYEKLQKNPFYQPLPFECGEYYYHCAKSDSRCQMIRAQSDWYKKMKENKATIVEFRTVMLKQVGKFGDDDNQETFFNRVNNNIPLCIDPNGQEGKIEYALVKQHGGPIKILDKVQRYCCAKDYFDNASKNDQMKLKVKLEYLLNKNTGTEENLVNNGGVAEEELSSLRIAKDLLKEPDTLKKKDKKKDEKDYLEKREDALYDAGALAKFLLDIEQKMMIPRMNPSQRKQVEALKKFVDIFMGKRQALRHDFEVALKALDENLQKLKEKEKATIYATLSKKLFKKPLLEVKLNYLFSSVEDFIDLEENMENKK